MIDFLKAVTKDQTHINGLYRYAKKNLKPHRPQNKNYECFSNGSARFRIEFRKIVSNGKLQGYYNAEVCFSPHYIFNNDLHNGNDFTPDHSAKVIQSIFQELGFSDNEMQDFKLVNLEYGLNLLPYVDVKNLIDGVIYTKKTPFKTNKAEYSKISHSTKYKQIKAYAKGLQPNFASYGIDPNTFRFEVKTKEYKHLSRMGFYNVLDLMQPNKYNALFQSLISEWDNVLVLNLEIKHKCNRSGFWNEIISDANRNKFIREKTKYYKSLTNKNNLHHLIKCKIIDKINEFSNGANSTHRTPINRGKQHFQKSNGLLINVENAPHPIEIKRCVITDFDISMQKKGSKFLCYSGLKFYKENDPETYRLLQEKYLTEKMRARSQDEQLYYIAHNIRNAKTNPHHNPRNSRKRFEQRNYPPEQLQLFNLSN